MDYKELIDELRMVASWNISDCYDCNQCVKAATAIETLSAERDAAVEDLKGRCGVCKHRGVCLFDEQHRIGCAVSNRGHWQWRGPQKGDGHD